MHARWSGLRHTPGPVLTFIGVIVKTCNEVSTKACCKNCVGHVLRLALSHKTVSGLRNAVGSAHMHASGLVLRLLRWLSIKICIWVSSEMQFGQHYEKYRDKPKTCSKVGISVFKEPPQTFVPKILVSWYSEWANCKGFLEPKSVN